MHGHLCVLFTLILPFYFLPFLTSLIFFLVPEARGKPAQLRQREYGLHRRVLPLHRTRSQPPRRPRRQDQSHEARCRQVVRRQRLRLWKGPTGEVIFIHASVVRGAEVLMIGTDAWVQVVRDDARAQGVWTRRVERGERQREGKQSGRTSEASSGVDGRAGSSVGEGSLRGAQPGLHDEPASYEQPVLFGREQFSCRERQLSLLAGTGFFNHAGGFRGTQPLIATRAQEVAAMLDETLGFHVKATGKDESLMRGQFTRMKLESLRKERDHWRTRAEAKQWLQDKKEEAWEQFQRQPRLGVARK